MSGIAPALRCPCCGAEETKRGCVIAFPCRCEVGPRTERCLFCRRCPTHCRCTNDPHVDSIRYGLAHQSHVTTHPAPVRSHRPRPQTRRPDQREHFEHGTASVNFSEYLADITEATDVLLWTRQIIYYDEAAIFTEEEFNYLLACAGALQRPAESSGD